MLHVFDDTEALVEAALDAFSGLAHAAVEKRGRFTVALAGGSTPRALYARLAQRPELPWDRVELCFGDERAVPPDHADSNARMVHETLTHEPFVDPAHVHRMRAELPPAEAAADYEQTLRGLFADAELPRFDLVLLGLGTDGHTASLFPHTKALGERTAWVVDNHVDKLGVDRITLTYPVLNAADRVLFLVTGADKANALRDTLEGTAAIEDVPARGVRPSSGNLMFLVDRAAASALS